MSTWVAVVEYMRDRWLLTTEYRHCLWDRWQPITEYGETTQKLQDFNAGGLANTLQDMAKTGTQMLNGSDIRVV